MAVEGSFYPQMEFGRALATDFVAYSKLHMRELTELLRRRNAIVRGIDAHIFGWVSGVPFTPAPRRPAAVRDRAHSDPRFEKLVPNEYP
jgi:hypothetical protein